MPSAMPAEDLQDQPVAEAHRASCSAPRRAEPAAAGSAGSPRSAAKRFVVVPTSWPFAAAIRRRRAIDVEQRAAELRLAAARRRARPSSSLPRPVISSSASTAAGRSCRAVARAIAGEERERQRVVRRHRPLAGRDHPHDREPASSSIGSASTIGDGLQPARLAGEPALARQHGHERRLERRPLVAVDERAPVAGRPHDRVLGCAGVGPAPTPSAARC